MRRMRADLGAVLLLVVLLLGGLLILTGCEEADTEDEETTETTEAVTDTTEAGSETTEGETTDTSEGDTTATTTADQGGESLAAVSEQFRVCADCHSDFNQFLQTSNVLTPNFSHALHLNQGIECEACHVVPTHEPDQINDPPMLKCFTPCHGQEEDATAPGECGACHPADFPLVPANHGEQNWLPVATQAANVETVDSQHSGLATQDRAYCEMCHAQQFCTNCHQMEMPHPGDWQASHPQTVSSAGKQSCERCHPNELVCNTCHHTGFQAEAGPWTQQHPPIVTNNGAEGCFGCHSPLTCAHCHVTGEFEEIEQGT